MKKIKNFLRNKDLFGHLITLNFNLRGNHHKTIIGGFFSIAIKAFIHIYVILNFVTLFTYGANTDGLLHGYEPIENLGTITSTEADINTFYVLRN